MTLTPRIKSLNAPDCPRPGPDKPAQTTPPIVALEPKRGGSKGNICAASASACSISVMGVPDLAVSTNSAG